MSSNGRPKSSNMPLTNKICVVAYTYILPQLGEDVNTEQRIVIVTGAESGIGDAVVELMLKDNCKVIGVDLIQNGSTDLDNPDYKFIQTDLTDLKKVDELFDYIKSIYGRIDILLNCAGITSLDGINEIISEKWDEMLDVNLKAVFFCCQNALKIMTKQKHGKIVNISSNAGVGGGKAVGIHYSTSKAGVIGLTKSLALYAADYNINVNCVAPGPTKTPMTDEWENEVNDRLKEIIPLKRFAAPKEVAEAIEFLASDKSDFITGETLNVNGGLLMN